MSKVREVSAHNRSVRSQLEVAYQEHSAFRLPYFAYRVLRERFKVHLQRFRAAALDSGTFVVANAEYRYFFHVYNKTWTNERAVEIPIARRFVQQATGRTLEVGNVLSHYYRARHEIVDKYERAHGVINEDVTTFTAAQPYDAIVSVSTLEHLGWDEDPPDETKAERAVQHLKTLLAPGGRMLVTVPLGQNDHLDRLIRERRSGFDRALYMRRTSSRTRWSETALEDLAGVRYGFPYPCGNGLFIGIAEKP